MTSVKTRILTEQINVERNPRPISTIHRAIPLREGDIKVVIFNKSQHGHQMIGLNSDYEPVRCWHDSDNTLLPMLSTKVSSEVKFVQKLSTIRPDVLYTNDGEPIREFISKHMDMSQQRKTKSDKYTLKVYGYENSCIKLMQTLRDEREQQLVAIDSKSRRNKFRKQKITPSVSFNEARVLMPNLTIKEYRSIYC